jgi:hypothetical protein
MKRLGKKLGIVVAAGVIVLGLLIFGGIKLFGADHQHKTNTGQEATNKSANKADSSSHAHTPTGSSPSGASASHSKPTTGEPSQANNSIGPTPAPSAGTATTNGAPKTLVNSGPTMPVGVFAVALVGGYGLHIRRIVRAKNSISG